MILKILILVFLLLIISLLLYFLMGVFVPAVLNQTKNSENIILSRFEHLFDRVSGHFVPSKIQERAFVFCSVNESFPHKINIKPYRDLSCKDLKKLFESDENCIFSCMGLGDCVKKCSQQAISMEQNTAVISDLCNGCGKCIPSCPTNVIRLVKVNENDSSKGIFTEEKSEFKFSDKNIEWKKKKAFNFWAFCYKLIKSVK